MEDEDIKSLEGLKKIQQEGRKNNKVWVYRDCKNVIQVYEELVNLNNLVGLGIGIPTTLDLRTANKALM